MKKLIRCSITAALSLLPLGQPIYGSETLDLFTYEALAGSEWTDHVRAFRKLFEVEKVDAFLEFGVGLGTKFFLDQCSKVTSIELLVKDRYTYVIPWYCDCLDLFRKYSSWSPSLHIFSQAVNDANNLAINNVNPEIYRQDYLIEMNQFLDQVFKNGHYDVAFVDPGMHIRGDLVNALFGRVDIIAAHDTNFNSACYGWYKVETPENYEKITCSFGSGITFWIVKSREDLIRKFKTALKTL